MNNLQCPNCTFVLEEGYAFCPKCGQAKIIDDSIRGFFNQFLEDYFTFDSKIFKSISPLLFRPGFLVNEYKEGKRIRYIPPLRIFIFTSILFFLLISMGNGHTKDMQETEIDYFFNAILPKLFFIFLPVFSLLLAWLFGQRGQPFTIHFLFSTYLHSFVFVLGAFYWILSRFLLSLGAVHLNGYLLMIMGLLIFIYLWVSLKKVYGFSTMNQGIRITGLLLGYLVVVVLSAFITIAVLLSMP
jgi:hypothetical protein